MIPQEKRFVRGILSASLSIFLFLLSFFFTALLLIRIVNVTMVIKNTDIYGVLEDTEIAHYMVSQLNSLPFNNTWINLYDVENFIKTDAVSNEIENIYKIYVKALNSNNLEYHLTENTVLGIVTNLEPELTYLFSHNMTEADNIVLTRTLDDILDFKGLTVSGIIYDVGVNAIVPRLMFSPYTLWGLGILIALLLCLTILHNTGKLEKTLMHSGIPIALSGVLYLLPGIILGSSPEMPGGRLLTLSKLTAGVIHLFIWSGIVLSAIGVILIVGSFVFKRLRSTGALKNKKNS